VTVRPFPRSATLSALSPYAARAADPFSDYDVATLALLRWWSACVSDPGQVDPYSLPSFHRDFVGWWRSDPDNQLAVLVDEVEGPSRVPVAMGWAVPLAAVPSPQSPGRRPARVDGVYVVPGVATPVVLDELRLALERLARDHDLVLTDRSAVDRHGL
jgi:hypothetical protein